MVTRSMLDYCVVPSTLFATATAQPRAARAEQLRTARAPLRVTLPHDALELEAA